MALPVRRIQLRKGDRVKLERIIRSRTSPQRMVERAKVVLASADGISGYEIAAMVGISRITVVRWFNRYEEEGIAAVLRRSSAIGAAPPDNPGTRSRGHPQDAP